MPKQITIFLTILFMTLMARAQLTFPNGKILDLQTDHGKLYEETEIPFHTGIYDITDYRWSKPSNEPDSMDTRWMVDACMNGRCKEGLPPSGDFEREFDGSDTTIIFHNDRAYIKLHVACDKYIGKSKIFYTISNKYNDSDFATVQFNISYSGPNGLNSLNKDDLKIYPNPVSGLLKIENFPGYDYSVFIYDLNGKVMMGPVYPEKEVSMDVSELPKGIYFMQFTSRERNSFYRKLIRN